MHFSVPGQVSVISPTVDRVVAFARQEWTDDGEKLGDMGLALQEALASSRAPTGLLKSGVYHGIATHDERIIRQTIEFARAEKIPPQAGTTVGYAKAGASHHNSQRAKLLLLYGLARAHRRKLRALNVPAVSEEEARSEPQFPVGPTMRPTGNLRDSAGAAPGSFSRQNASDSTRQLICHLL
jgi:hypothetical protein